ncbi:hypothetical protein K439DRAFT_1348666 [Ramaria rubella]|nr:hypothetical protein K439DRAFT_1348666 [Ramaria rubella]
MLYGGPVDHRIQLTSAVLNGFMARAMYFRRPDIVFRLWDTMTSYYGVDGSPRTLDILFRSARLAASMETALSSFIPQWMINSSGIFRNQLVFPSLSAEILWMLGPECSPNMKWNGIEAWRVARHVFREEIIFANWPWLRNIEVPARAVRGDAATGQIEALKEYRTDRGLWSTKIRHMGKYPHLMPSQRTCRHYITMLGRVQRSSEIPEVLAWMKALQLRPSRRTLSIAIALWSQVGLDSPADDGWGMMQPTHPDPKKEAYASLQPQNHGGEYSRLLTWLEEWLGTESVPDEGEVLEAFKFLRELEQKERNLY